MLYALLAVKCCASFLVCFLVLLFFQGPFETLATKALTPEIWLAWKSFIYLSVYVMALSRGVLVAELENLSHRLREKKSHERELTRDDWALEVIKTLIESLKGVAIMLLIFLGVATVIVLIRMKFVS